MDPRRGTKYWFFQKVVAAQQRRGTIQVLTGFNGAQLTTFSQISEETVTFFKNLIGTRDPAVSEIPKNILEEVLNTSITKDIADELCMPISVEEIKQSMFSIKNKKAPGLDGFSSHFFKAAWSVVEHDDISAIMQFFHSNSMLLAFNSTSISLVPKTQSLYTIKDFRPISCCTVVYKCITKILSNRLKSHMSAIISCNQSDFIAGRSITDNMLMAQELVKGYGHNTLSLRCAIKVDL